MLDNNDLFLLTLASDHKIHLLRRFTTRQLEDEKLHYKTGFPKWLPMFPVTVGPLKVRIICDEENWKQCDFASASEILKEAWAPQLKPENFR